MYFIICPAAVGGHLFHELNAPAQQALYIAVFQAGWFVESMWSQTLVIHMIRTPKIPFLQSHASAPVTFITFIGIAVLTVIPFTPLGHAIGLASLPADYFGWLAAIILAYMILATVMKKLYIRRYGELL
jgi:Mg2+-importing ATPase